VHRRMQRHCFRVRGGTNLNCTFQLKHFFSHSCTAYQRLKFCVRSLLDGPSKREKFCVRFRPDKLDHPLDHKWRSDVKTESQGWPAYPWRSVDINLVIRLLRTRKDERIGKWRKLHIEEFCDFFHNMCV
jgi:hypothetical protein